MLLRPVGKTYHAHERFDVRVADPSGTSAIEAIKSRLGCSLERGWDDGLFFAIGAIARTRLGTRTFGARRRSGINAWASEPGVWYGGGVGNGCC